EAMDAVGETAFTMMAGARLPGVSRGVLGEFALDREMVLVGEQATINTKAMLQTLTNRAFAELKANPGLARELMSPGSYQHLVNQDELAGASFGKAIERLVGRYVARDPKGYGTFLSYESKPFKSTPDFFGYEGGKTRYLDITTQAGVGSHLDRWYGKDT